MAPNGQMLINFGEAPRHEATIVPLHAGSDPRQSGSSTAKPVKKPRTMNEAVVAYRRAICQ